VLQQVVCSTKSLVFYIKLNLNKYLTAKLRHHDHCKLIESDQSVDDNKTELLDKNISHKIINTDENIAPTVRLRKKPEGGNINKDEVLQWTYTLYDVDGSGSVTPQVAV
jgi:hypothetical protein